MIPLQANVDGIDWSAVLYENGDAFIYRGNQRFDKGYDDGEMIHDTVRTPEYILRALEDSWEQAQ